MNPNSGRGSSQSKGGERMNTDRLGKLLEAWRLAVESAVNDGGVERATREEEIRALIGGVEAAPNPWPDTVRKASEGPGPGRGVAVVGGCLALARGALFRRMAQSTGPRPRDMARSCTVPRCGPIVG